MEAAGVRLHVVDPEEAKARRGRTRRSKMAKLDARGPARLLAKQDLPEVWTPPKLRMRTVLVGGRGIMQIVRHGRKCYSDNVGAAP